MTSAHRLWKRHSENGQMNGEHVAQVLPPGNRGFVLWVVLEPLNVVASPLLDPVLEVLAWWVLKYIHHDCPAFEDEAI